MCTEKEIREILSIQYEGEFGTIVQLRPRIITAIIDALRAKEMIEKTIQEKIKEKINNLLSNSFHYKNCNEDGRYITIEELIELDILIDKLMEELKNENN